MAFLLHLPPPTTFFFLLLLLFALPLSPSTAMTQMEALLLLKKSITNATSLNSWTPDSPPCGDKTSWVGVICSSKGAVVGLRLGGMGLSGKIDVDALLNLPQLRSISFTDNAFSGPIPSFDRLGALKAIYLTGNQLSGEIPSDFFSKMESLRKIWLSKNYFSGPIPTSLSKLKPLIELHLENNGFSGAIPPMDQPSLESFNVSDNALGGEIPAGLQRFNMSSFAGNEGLCGDQVATQCEKVAVMATSSEINHGNDSVAVVSVVVVVVFCVVGLVLTMRVKQGKSEFEKLGGNMRDSAVEVHVVELQQSTSSVQKEPLEGRGKKGVVVPQLMMVNEERGVFGLPELMKASAEVLGNGGLGSSYKAVMGNGVVMVVKRMREMNRVGDDGFEAEIRQLGRLRHPNVLPPLAFHFRREEKLIIYEYIPKGSLLYLLHAKGDRALGQEELSWPLRLKIIRGIARGLAYIHEELASSDIPHGNLKSSNVLLGPDLEPLLVDYGFFPLIAPQRASQAMFAHRSPESLQCRHVSPKSDVYCLGILILEILTAKFPSQYLTTAKGATDVVRCVVTAISERRELDAYDPEILGCADWYESMARCLRLGLACAEPNPEKRLDAREALRRIEKITSPFDELMP